MKTVRSVLGPYVGPYRRVLMLGGLAAIVEVLAGLAQPWPLKLIVDSVLTGGHAEEPSAKWILAACLGGLGVVVAIAALADYWSTRLLTSVGMHMTNNLREDVFAHLGRMSLQYHGNHQVGDLTSRVTGDTDRAQDLVTQSLAVLLPNALLLVGMAVVMVVLDPMFALIALATTPLLGVVVVRFTRRLQSASRRARKADGELAAAVSESLSAIHLVQAFALEGRQQSRIESLTDSSLNASLEAVRYQSLFSPAVDMSALAATILVMAVGSLRVMDERLSVGELLVFISYVGAMYKPVKALAKLANTFSKGTTSVERLAAVFAEAPAVDEQRDAPWLRPSRGYIEFNSVTCRYGEEPALDDVSLTVHPGETVALVGPTGAGKSTMAALVPRLIDPVEGAVLIDGVDIKSVALASVRNQVSMVLQDCVLLRGTLRDNIALGRRWARASDVERAARLALVDEFACRLPNGLDTPVGERGANLSGGQRQRIAIARALLRDAPILILDEPTSALDPASEELIVEALASLPKGRTTIVVAHRLTTIEHADRIVVLDRAKIREQGSHQQLLDDPDSLYRRFHRTDRQVSAL